jgi:hypothetical protein
MSAANVLYRFDWPGDGAPAPPWLPTTLRGAAVFAVTTALLGMAGWNRTEPLTEVMVAVLVFALVTAFYARAERLAQLVERTFVQVDAARLAWNDWAGDPSGRYSELTVLPIDALSELRWQSDSEGDAWISVVAEGREYTLPMHLGKEQLPPLVAALRAAHPALRLVDVPGELQSDSSASAVQP